jgi:mRNA interferase RelE/StbE
MNFDFSRRAAKEIRRLNEPLKGLLLDAIYALPLGDVKELAGCKGLLRLRVGNFRVLFSYQARDTILIEKVEPRGQAYKRGTKP